MSEQAFTLRCEERVRLEQLRSNVTHFELAAFPTLFGTSATSAVYIG